MQLVGWTPILFKDTAPKQKQKQQYFFKKDSIDKKRRIAALKEKERVRQEYARQSRQSDQYDDYTQTLLL